MRNGYYVAEQLNRASKRKAVQTRTDTIKGAKRAATRRQMFQNTILLIGTAVDENGFIIDPVFIKENGKWYMC